MLRTAPAPAPAPALALALAIACASLLLSLAACPSPLSASADEGEYEDAPLVNAVATVGVMDLGSGPMYVLYPDAEPGTRYCVDEGALPPSLRHDGARVRISGQAGDIPATVRLACSPFELHSIQHMVGAD